MYFGINPPGGVDTELASGRLSARPSRPIFYPLRLMTLRLPKAKPVPANQLDAGAAGGGFGSAASNVIRAGREAAAGLRHDRGRAADYVVPEAGRPPQIPARRWRARGRRSRPENRERVFTLMNNTTSAFVVGFARRALERIWLLTPTLSWAQPVGSAAVPPSTLPHNYTPWGMFLAADVVVKKRDDRTGACVVADLDNLAGQVHRIAT